MPVNDDGNLSFRVKMHRKGSERVILLQFLVHNYKIGILEKMSELLEGEVYNLKTLATLLERDFPEDKIILNLLKDFSKKNIIPKDSYDIDHFVLKEKCDLLEVLLSI